jgi:hypothetical protein
MTQDAATYTQAPKGNAAYRAHRRKTDSRFAESERLSNQRYRDANKWARAFADAHQREFESFKRDMIAIACSEGGIRQPLPAPRQPTPMGNALHDLKAKWKLDLA